MPLREPPQDASRKDPLQEATEAGETVADRIRQQGGDLAPAFEAAEAAARAYQAAHGNLDQVLPATEEIGLGFSRGFPDGKTILRAYAEALSEDVCNPSGNLHKRIKAAASVSVSSLIGWFLTALGLSITAASLLAPIAGAIAGLGLVAFCRACKEV